MDNLKTILTLIAAILIALGVLAGIGLIYSLLPYVLVLAVVCLAGFLAVRFLSKPDPKQLQAPDPKRELDKVQRLLDQYKKQDRR